MDTLAKSDAFFFVTTVCIIIVTVVLVVVGAYFVRIAADLKHIVKRAKQETDEIADDLKTARETLKDKGRSFGTIISSLFFLAGRRKKKKREEE